MISYEDLQRLDGDNADELRALIDRRQELSDLPLSRGRVTAFEALYREAERLEVPHFMASARYEQHQTLLLGESPSKRSTTTSDCSSSPPGTPSSSTRPTGRRSDATCPRSSWTCSCSTASRSPR